jgi:hypothetical protein
MVSDLRLLPSGTWCSVFLHTGTNILKKTAASSSTLKMEARGSAETYVPQAKQRVSCLTQLQSFPNISEHLASPQFQKKNR